MSFELLTGSPYLHNTPGAVKRVIQTLMNKLRKLCDFGRFSLERCLEKATFAVKISFNGSINTSPYIFKFGKEPILNIDTSMKPKLRNEPIQEIAKRRDKH